MQDTLLNLTPADALTFMRRFRREHGHYVTLHLAAGQFAPVEAPTQAISTEFGFHVVGYVKLSFKQVADYLDQTYSPGLVARGARVQLQVRPNSKCVFIGRPA